MTVKIQLRRDTSSNWSSINPVLSLGEPGFETDTNKIKFGDGTSAWNSLSYVTQDFINIVSAGGIADLTVNQQGQIVEGTIVLTSDGVRWVYLGSGSKILEASYVQLADISPAWLQITSKPNSLVGLENITSTASGDFILTSGNNIYYATNFAESVDDRVGSLIVAGSGINVSYNDGGNSLTVAVSGLISNPTNNRLLTSRDNTTTGIDAESNLTFDGSTLTVTGDVSANYYFGDFDGAVVYDCKNNTDSQIAKGTPVYISGHFANGKVYIAPARSDDSSKMPAFGLLGDTLDPSDEGHVHIFGALSNIDTQTPGYTIGQTLYIAPTGGLTLTRPTSETHLIQNIGRVARVHNSNGRIVILGPGRTNDVPNSISAYKLDIDNIRIDDNTISSTNSNGNLLILPNGTGKVGVGTSSPSVEFHTIGSGLFTQDLNISGVLKPIGFQENLIALGNTGASTTLSLASGTVQTATLSATCTFTMPTAAAGKSFTLFLTQGNNYTATFTSVKWPNNSGPAISASGKIDILSFISDGTSWYGSAVQNF